MSFRGPGTLVLASISPGTVVLALLYWYSTQLKPNFVVASISPGTVFCISSQPSTVAGIVALVTLASGHLHCLNTTLRRAKTKYKAQNCISLHPMAPVA